MLLAPPGAGKTTCVPPALSRALPNGQIWVLEPRRLAARLAATHVARSLGQAVGQEVGYTVRFENRSGPRTKIRYLTTGVALRRLAHDPTLQGVAAVIFDEFHERHLDCDLLFAWLATKRLPLLVMSATLAPEPIAKALGDAPIIVSTGRAHPVTLAYAPRQDDRPLSVKVRAAVATTHGDTLVFLPGLADIERCTTALADLGHAVFPLHASLNVADTRRALGPAPARKIVLATNVAESSVTIPNITTVIDSGLHKVAHASPWTGFEHLDLQDIPRDSADQRAGRAGRTAKGHCRRLYTQASYQRRPPALTPEIQRLDLTQAVLTLALLGVQAADALPWLDPPKPAAWAAAHTLLVALGALTQDGAPTPLGATLARLPLHPRLGRLLLSGGPLSPLAAALLSTGARPRDIGRDGPSDIQHLIDTAQHQRRSPAARVAKQLAQIRPKVRVVPDQPDPQEQLQRALLDAFPDRVIRRRKDGSWQLQTGPAARVGPYSVVRHEPWAVAIELRGGARPMVHLASAIDPEWLLELPTADQDLVQTTEFGWDDTQERVTAQVTLRWRGLLLEARPTDPRGAPQAAALLAKRARAAGLGRFADPAALDRLINRRRIAHEADPTLPRLTVQEALAVLDRLCQDALSFKDLRKHNLIAALESTLSWDQRARFSALTPDRIQLPNGHAVAVRYPPEGPPKVSVRVQRLLGLTQGPRLGPVPILLELLAPNQRPIQVTSDLAGFWANTWPAVRKELRGRYAKHAWPEDPTVTPPPRRRRPR